MARPSTTTKPAAPQWRYDIELPTPALLVRAMTHRGYTVRSLAREVGCGESVIGHLRSGRRKSCSPQVARDVERILDVPPGMLFVVKSPIRPGDTRRTRIPNGRR